MDVLGDWQPVLYIWLDVCLSLQRQKPLRVYPLVSAPWLYLKAPKGGGTIDLEYVATSFAVYCQIRSFLHIGFLHLFWCIRGAKKAISTIQ